MDSKFDNVVIQQLRNYLSSDPSFKEAFEESFNKARNAGIPQFEEWKINTFDDFIDHYETYLYWTPTEDCTGANVYYHFCLFYFVLDLPPVKGYLSPIEPDSVHPARPWTWLTQWLVLYAKEMGKFMDSPESLTPDSLASFYRAEPYHLWDYEKPPGGWKTFNEFFARRIKPEVRPIAAISDPTVIISPADSKFDGKWTIDQKAEIQFKAKGVPWSISQLLQDSAFGKQFKGGQFMHALLSPHDYHRLHAAVAGRIVEAKVVPGMCYVHITAEKDTTGLLMLGMHQKLDAPTMVIPHKRARLHAPNEPGYQFLQARGVIVIDNPDIGLVAICPIGMAQVSSVVLSVKRGDYVNKGDEISYFQLGGSDVVVVFQERSKVDITATSDHFYNMGTEIATATILKE